MIKDISREQKGFTLLEVLLAVMILGISLTTILLQFQTALHAGSISQERTIAVIYAKEKLEALKIDSEITESSLGGSFDDGYEWETEISLYEYEDPTDENSYENLKNETYKLRSTIKWNSGQHRRQAELTTLKTVRKEEWSE